MTDEKHGATPQPETDAPAEGATGLHVALEGFEGPIDLLLSLARDQKVDLARISILRLAEQYIAYIEQARGLRLEVAAEYLVMAAWLAYLKSRLLLPTPPPEDEPQPEDMAAALAFQLQRLEAMQHAAARLFDRPLLGRDRLPRGHFNENIPTRTVWTASLPQLLTALTASMRRHPAPMMAVRPLPLIGMEDAAAMLRRILPGVPEWRELSLFLPQIAPNADTGLAARSRLAATLSAGLELCREGVAELRQEQAFGPIWLRRRQEPVDPILSQESST